MRPPLPRWVKRFTSSRRLKTVALYGAMLGLTVAVLASLLRLRDADLRVPFLYQADALCVQAWTKATIENGWYLANPSLGAPFGQEMYDFPLLDGLHFVVMKALSWLVGDFAAVVNLYDLLTFPLAAATALHAFRRFGVCPGPATLASVLYAFLPYHFARGEAHLFLAAYYLVPLAVVQAIEVFVDDSVATGPRPPQRRTRRATAVVGLAIGAGGIYYAFFTCYFLVMAGATVGLSRRGWKPVREALLKCGWVVASVAVGVAPTLWYRVRHGPNPAAVSRWPAQTELFGLKLPLLVLPVSGHRIPALARLKLAYDAAFPGNFETSTATLGALGGIGFLALVGWLFLRRARSPRPLVDALSLLNLAALLLAMSGGLCTLVGVYLSPSIRAYTRISVFVAFFALFAVALGLAWVGRRCRTRGGRLAFHLGLLALGVVGILDQTPQRLVPLYGAVRREFKCDRAFVERLEASLPAHSMIFQLPQTGFPEELPAGRMGTDDHLRLYLHSRTLRWSFGAMKGRHAGQWQTNVACLPTPEMLQTLALAGFAGVTIDRAGYEDHGLHLEAKLVRCVGGSTLESDDGRFVFLSLAPYSTGLRNHFTPEQWVALRDRALNRVTVSWLGGTVMRAGEPFPTWCGRLSSIALTNPSPTPRRVRLVWSMASSSPGRARVLVKGPGFTQVDEITGTARELSREMSAPPGTAVLQVACNAPVVAVPGLVTVPGAPTGMALRVDALRVEEQDTRPAPAQGADRSLPAG